MENCPFIDGLSRFTYGTGRMSKANTVELPGLFQLKPSPPSPSIPYPPPAGRQGTVMVCAPKTLDQPHTSQPQVVPPDQNGDFIGILS